MSSPLQKAPSGILGAFLLKVLGKNPNQFGDVVTPTVEVFDHYLLQQELKNDNGVGAGTITLTAGAQVVRGFATVPNGKVWRVLASGVFCTVAAADVALGFNVGLYVRMPGGAVTPFFTGQTNGAATSRTAGFYFPRPLTLPAGWAIAVDVFAPTAASQNMATTLQLTYHEFDL